MPIQHSVGKGGVNQVDEVRLVQGLLNDWRGENNLPPIAEDGLVGPETIGAILDFQSRVTHIVDGRVDPGGPAITELEKDQASAAEVASAVLLFLQYFDHLLLRTDSSLPAGLQQKFNVIRLEAWRLLRSERGGSAQPFEPTSPDLKSAFDQGKNLLGVAGVAAAPLVFAGGVPAAVAVGVLAIAALLVLLVFVIVDPQVRHKVAKLRQELIDAANKAVVETVTGVNAMRGAVDQCKRRLVDQGLLADPEWRKSHQDCLDAFTNFENKINELNNKSNQIQQILRQLENWNPNNPFGPSMKLNLILLERFLRELLRLTFEANALVNEVLDKCGCRFLGR
jgi:peptidoglycan hydrolase-like protein with peptidoglycan-binding domain